MGLWKQLAGMIAGDASKFSLSVRLCIAAVFIVIQVVLLALTPVLFRLIKKKITSFGQKQVRLFTIKKLKLLESERVLNAVYVVLKILMYAFILLQLSISIPLVFSLFVLTQNLAAVFFGYILTPLKTIFFDFISYIPNLITIIIFVIIAKYIVRVLRFLAGQIEKRKLVLNGFYPDWAQPTYNILRFLIYAFTVAVVYPYLPGADSSSFQGVSVFVGIIVSLGSTSAIGNLVAGIVLTYMRPFRIGDRITIQNVTGFVEEKSPFNTRIRTHKNEYVTFPNMMVLNSSITNFDVYGSGKKEGLILYAEITFGYGTPWQTVHEILLRAAGKTDRVLQDPEPFVLQTGLEDFYARYQINVYTKEIDYVPAIYSELFKNIQNEFREAGLDMTAAHFRINLPPAAQAQVLSGR
ncbi:MAG: mechanosensitive ion channel family protein [Treponema sp.]|jgi:small-conductance mechanosensitive channel|nr:mechanosensitive ion channel family protein [Treponema sp.]